MSQAAVSAPAAHLLEWLAISLTPGLGPTKARKLVEHFGSAEAVFRASLTELEATGIPIVSAQSLATGKSQELAREEIAQAAAAGVTLVSLDDPSYPPRLKEIYDPPLILRVRGNLDALDQSRNCHGRNAPSYAVRIRHGRAPGVRPCCPGTGHY